MPSCPRIRRPDAEVIAIQIARSRRLVWSAAARKLEERGESMLAWQVLNRLRCEGPMTQRDLAFGTGQHPAGISRILETLEADGDVRRARDTSDRRKIRVELTSKALARLAAADPVLCACAEEVLAPLTTEERTTLRLLLGKLLGQDDLSRE